jgi:hypothetical protein
MQKVFLEKMKEKMKFDFTFSEREGFEPSVRIELVQRISNQPLSTTQPSLLLAPPRLRLFAGVFCSSHFA